MGAVRTSTGSWFRTADGRRYGLEIVVVISAKILLLWGLYVVFVAPQARVDTSPPALRERLTESSPVQATP
jgi:hypothetical protein